VALEEDQGEVLRGLLEEISEARLGGPGGGALLLFFVWV
jgi:hypothetical protein